MPPERTLVRLNERKIVIIGFNYIFFMHALLLYIVKQIIKTEEESETSSNKDILYGECGVRNIFFSGLKFLDM